MAFTPNDPKLQRLFNTGTTATNPAGTFAEDAARKAKEEAKSDCIAKGGVWNEQLQTCSFPREEQKEEFPKVNPTGGFQGTPSGTTSPEMDKKIQEQAAQEQAQYQRGFEVIRDAETGRLSGFRRGDQTLLGLSPDEVTALATKESELQELPVGGQAETVLSRRQQELQSQGLDLSAQVGQSPGGQALAQLEQAITGGEVDYIAALKSTVPGLIPDFLTGFGGAAIFTKGGTAGIAPTLIGIGNAVRGSWGDFVRDVQKQKGEIIETPIRTLTETKSILNDITSAQNANPADAVANLEAFNTQLAAIDQAYETLKEETDGDLNKFLGENGINQLQEYEVYYLPGGERDRQIADMQLALANPDPARVKVDSVTTEEINKLIEKRLESQQ